jgi:hypothetical protein
MEIFQRRLNIIMMEQEEYLDNFIERWKAGAEQIDDILIIGVRITEQIL